MCRTNYNRNKGYSHLTLSERLQIERWLKKDSKSLKEIALLLNKSVRTIQREIKRGNETLLNSDLTNREEYCAEVAQRKYDKNLADKGPQLKVGNDYALVNYLEAQLSENKMSPEAAIASIKNNGLEFDTEISARTLRNYIDNGLVFNLDDDHSIYKRSKKKKARKVSLRSRVPKEKNIAYRPTEVDSREVYGHWEGDCVVGQREGQNNVLLTLTERKTRELIIIKIKRKDNESVIKAIDKLERKYKSSFKKIFKTITFDNGSEFLNYQALETSCLQKEKRTRVYYANPYCSWERGSNENNNRLIRRWFPKGTNFNKITNKEIKNVENWVNNYPRKIFGYKSTNMLLSN